MEIKRRLGKIQKALSPQIEAMNVASEMEQMCSRFEELVRYAQEKIDRTEQRGESLAAQQDRDRREADRKVTDQQDAEAEENLRDQQEAADARAEPSQAE